MVSDPLDIAFEDLQESAKRILVHLFNPMGLIRIANASVILDEHQQRLMITAEDLFIKRQYKQAYQHFDELRLSLGNQDNRQNRIIIWNLAACATVAEEYFLTIQLLTPFYEGGSLYGLPLWNLALAYFRTGQLNQAFTAMQTFITRDTEQNHSRQARGELISASLSLLLGDNEKGRDHLERAISLDINLVKTQLKQLRKTNLGDRISMTSVVDDNSVRLLSIEEQNELLALAQPKKPGREPRLSLSLSPKEIEQFTRAIENLSEGDTDNVLQDINELRRNHPNVEPLEATAAAVKLFMNDHESAREIFQNMEQAGLSLSGASLWNLACAQIFLRDYSGAQQTLDKCFKTEYKTKPQLRKAIQILSQKAPADNQTKSSPSSLEKSTPASLTWNLPNNIQEARVEVLTRVLRPRRIPKLFRPDLVRLSQRDRQNVSNVLDEAYRTGPSAASELLIPLIEQYPDIYTLRVHAATHLLFAGQMNRANSVYHDASQIRNLDNVSLFNLATISFVQGELASAQQILESGIRTSLSDEYTFFLALAILRAINGQGDAEESAARAMTLVLKSPNERIVREVLRTVSIVPATNVTSISTPGPIALAARKALSLLNSNNISEAVATLESIKVRIEQVPEIGPLVFEPQFVRKPNRDWHPKYVQSFINAVQLYSNGQYSEASAVFSDVVMKGVPKTIAINISAALMKMGEPLRARKYTKINNLSRGSNYNWMLTYNRALSFYVAGETDRAIQAIRQFRKPVGRNLNLLLVALSAPRSNDELPREGLEGLIDELLKSVYKPSDDLIVWLVWIYLKQVKPELSKADEWLRALSNLSPIGPLPAVEVTTIPQVRDAFEHLKLAGEYKEAVGYMTTIIETRTRYRQSLGIPQLTSRELEYNIGVELWARLSLIRTYNLLEEKERAIREVDETENFLKSNERFLAPGIKPRNWFYLAEASYEIDLPWATLRYCSNGLAYESENVRLHQLSEQINHQIEPQIVQKHYDTVINLLSALQRSDFLASRLLIRNFPTLLNSVLDELISQLIMKEEKIDIEELCDRIAVIAHIELPDQASKAIDDLLSWLNQDFGGSEETIPVDIEVYDERIWPRADDDREGSCLFSVIPHVDITLLVINDPLSDRRIWEGALPVGSVQYVRWTFYREDGFTPDSYVDLPIHLSIRTSTEKTETTTSFNVVVGPIEQTWPEYPTGSLSPEDIPGQDLFGRLQLIKRITRSLGRKRSQATFFLQSPRQMGKTSLLNFVKRQTPEQVLPVYVNLEKPWSSRDPRNIWNYLLKRLREESFGKILAESNQDYTESDLIMEVTNICSQQNKEYVLFLIDEFHFVFDCAKNPRDILASFRDFLNIQDNRIAIVFADRYTRDELEARCPSEYWDQLTLLLVGPLDAESTKLALEYPTRGTDVTFLPETIEYIYKVTGGYPYHVQRIAQDICDQMFTGPWLTALPKDIDDVIPRMINQNSLFTSGLCRPERIDGVLFEAIAALLEWKDLCDFLPILISEMKDVSEIFRRWKPNPRSFISHLNNPDFIESKLRDIGILSSGSSDFFSPLLELWLRKMRRLGVSISQNHDASHWQMISSIDGSALHARDWQNLDNELVRRAKYKGKAPLKEKSSRSDDWDTLVKDVTSESSFTTFLDVMFRLFIDDRDEKEAMLQYPWLYFSYHRARLVRNYVTHRSKSQSALAAWNALCTRAFGGERIAYWPVTSDEWHALQLGLLRNLYAGLHNAIELAGQNEF